MLAYLFLIKVNEHGEESWGEGQQEKKEQENQEMGMVGGGGVCNLGTMHRKST